MAIVAQEEFENKIRQQDGPRKGKVRKGLPEESEVAGSRKDELDGWLRDVTLVEVQESDIIGEPRIFGSRFFDDLKRVGEHFRMNSRLVARKYSDEGAATISRKALTVHHFRQRLALCLVESTPGLMMYTRD